MRSSQSSASDIVLLRCLNLHPWFSVAFVSTSWVGYDPYHTSYNQPWGIQFSILSPCMLEAILPAFRPLRPHVSWPTNQMLFFKLKSSVLLFSINPQIVGPVSRSHNVLCDPALSFTIWLHESMSDEYKYISDMGPWETVGTPSTGLSAVTHSQRKVFKVNQRQHSTD